MILQLTHHFRRKEVQAHHSTSSSEMSGVKILPIVFEMMTPRASAKLASGRVRSQQNDNPKALDAIRDLLLWSS